MSGGAFKSARARVPAGFTLIELIGVLAVLAILASVIAPNVLRRIDRAEVSAERQTLRELGAQVRLHLRQTGVTPTSANWATALAAYADLSPAAVAANPRQIARVYLTDPATTPATATRRVLMLSTLRGGLALPAAANINTAARFQEIWDTPDGEVPPVTSWTGWSAWAAVAVAGEQLVIERVNLESVYLNELQSFTITLNHQGASPVSYAIVPAGGVAGAPQTLTPGATAIVSALRANDRVNLYRASGGVDLGYSYVLATTGKTFDFDGTHWRAQ